MHFKPAGYYQGRVKKLKISQGETGMRRGFTLIELLVVITILAVLAGAAMPYVQSYVEEARLAKAKADLEEIARALTVYETREGEYNFGDVSVLTGRYLNKSPIDPWGKAYAVATEDGFVYSGGPDRDPNAKDDNLFFPYQPPLALVQVKWVDKNNSGAVDTQNISDELHLTFSRKLSCNPDDVNKKLGSCFAIGSSSILPITEIVDGGDDPIVWASAVSIVASKTMILKVKFGSKNLFVVGSHTISVCDGHGTLTDLANPKNLCIASQPVVILPQ